MDRKRIADGLGRRSLIAQRGSPVIYRSSRGDRLLYYAERIAGPQARAGQLVHLRQHPVVHRLCNALELDAPLQPRGA